MTSAAAVNLAIVPMTGRCHGHRKSGNLRPKSDRCVAGPDRSHRLLPMRAPIRVMAATAAAAAAAIAAIVAVPAASTASLPPPIITPRPTITLHLYPDLTIGRAGGCTWYTGAEGD